MYFHNFEKREGNAVPRSGDRVKHYVDPHKIRENVDSLPNKSVEEKEMLYCFSSRLNDVMHEKDISQEEMGIKIGASSGAISAYRNGKKGFPSIATLAKIAKFLNVSADYLLGISEVQSTKEDFKTAAKTTGLTETTIRRLRSLTQYKGYAEIIDEIIRHSGFTKSIEQLYKYVNSKLVSDHSYMLHYGKDGKQVDEIGHMIEGSAIKRMYAIDAQDLMTSTVKVFIRKRVEGENNG